MAVAVIGSGASGLAAIKCCVDEELQPTCFERQDVIGGLWNYVPGEKDGATIYKSTVINTSKEMSSFSDFPAPKEFPNFMPHYKALQYLKLYAEKLVTVKNTITQEVKVDVFDGVLVCIGHHAIPNYPLSSFPGIESFKGQYCHSNSYRTHHGYEDKNVVVIGIGNSGGDIAVELSRHAKQVYLSTRRGTWVKKRIGPNGLPGDYMGRRRYKHWVGKLFPNYVLESVRRDVESRIDHQKYCLRPSHDVMSQHPSVNDALPERIMTGILKVKSLVVSFKEHSALFDDGTEEDVDAVIFATGYKIAYPFLSEDILKVNENMSDLYKYVFPLNSDRPTLAIIGCVQPLGSAFPIAEMQSRWATKVIKDELELPSKEVMRKDIAMKRKALSQRYVSTPRHTIQVDFIPYMDEIAEQICCKPCIWKWALKDPKLASKIVFGANLSYIYRLQGPGQWSGAREAIMTADERVLYPLTTRKVQMPQRKSASAFMICSGVVLLVVLTSVMLTKSFK